MFTFALALFAGHRYFLFIFKLFLLFAERGRRNMEESSSQQKPLTTITKCVRRRVSNWSLCLLCSILIIFFKRKCISKSWRRLMNYKPENRIPWPFTEFDSNKDFPRLFKKFPDFSPTLKNFCFSLTFPWPWQPRYNKKQQSQKN